MAIYMAREWWKKNDNTIIHLPLSTSIIDDTRNNNITSTNVTFSGWFSVFDWSNSTLKTTGVVWVTWNPKLTFQMWVKHTRQATECCISIWNFNDAEMIWFFINDSNKVVIWTYNDDPITDTVVNLNTWTLITITTDWYTTKVYKNWVLSSTATKSYTIVQWNIWIWFNQKTTSYKYKWNISDVIVEKWVWSAEQISDYYNSTKSIYWL